MAEQTPLDMAHQIMQNAPEDEAARMRFYERLADSELFLLLKEEAVGDSLLPEMIEVEGVKYLLVFDREERLAEFARGSAHHAALSGRVIATMLAGQEIGLGLNLDVAPSSILIPDQALIWLGEMLAGTPDQVMEKPEIIERPTGLPEALLTSLDMKLASAAGMAKTAYLVAVTYHGGRRSHMLAIIDAVPQAQGALAKAVNEALSFSAIEASELDVTFLAAGDPVCGVLEKVGLRFDLPENKVQSQTISPPGGDPNSPPILR